MRKRGELCLCVGQAFNLASHSTLESGSPDLPCNSLAVIYDTDSHLDRLAISKCAKSTADPCVWSY